jgi:peptidoglycan/LPS O-acetylase OafA/YrhL
MGRRLAWLEGIRIFAAVILLIYHAQLLFTDYAYMLQPTGLLENFYRMGDVTARIAGSGTGVCGFCCRFGRWRRSHSFDR